MGTDDMIERCQACFNSNGIGASIQSLAGDVWGRVVGDEGHCWRLHTGRIARKDTEGLKWCWTETAEVAVDNLETAEKSDLLFIKGLGSAVRPGFSVVNSEYIAFHPHQCLLCRYHVQCTDPIGAKRVFSRKAPSGPVLIW